MKECPACRRCFPDEINHCPHDGDATAPSLLGETILDERYQLEKRLGQGGMGVVFQARHIFLKTSHAIKVILPDLVGNDPMLVTRFRQEALATAAIRHQNIIAVTDFGVVRGTMPFLVMEFVNGKSLQDIIAKEKKMSPARALEFICAIGAGVSAAHCQNIVHRDLKPLNIMVQEGMTIAAGVKILDFGLAKIKSRELLGSFVQAKTSGLIGSPFYMAPEQWSDEEPDPRADVYGLGIILYQMLSGDVPFKGNSIPSIMKQHLTRPPPSFKSVGVEISPRVEAAVFHALEKEVDARTPTVEAFLKELRAAVEAGGTTIDTITGDLADPILHPSAEAATLKRLSFDPEYRYAGVRDFKDVPSSSEIGAHDEECESKETLALETAHVLFMDIVGYSKLDIDRQRTRLAQLQQIVLATNECRQTRSDNLIRLPTGDGFALVFFGDPEAPLRCAVEISKALTDQPEIIDLRMGVHSGFVYRIADINTNMNVAGGGINIAQRVMDCGEGGHILVSNRVADDLLQLARWSNYLHDLGTTEVKHDLRLHVFSLYGDDFGNPERPAKFAIARRSPIYRRTASVAAITIAVLGLGIAAAWFGFRPAPTPVTQPAQTETVAPVGPEQSLTYWVTVQKMLNARPLGAPFESAGDISYGTGWKFRFNFRPMQSGAFYLLNVGPGEKGADEHNVLFPVPLHTKPLAANEKLDASLAANTTVQLPLTGWFHVADQVGVEKLWMIWSTQPIPELDTIFSDAARNQKDPGVISSPDEIARLQSYFKKYESSPPEAIADKSRKVTSVKGRGEVLVNRVELSHEAY